MKTVQQHDNDFGHQCSKISRSVVGAGKGVTKDCHWIYTCRCQSSQSTCGTGLGDYLLIGKSRLGVEYII